MPLGWIDFSKTERGKVLSVLDLLSESSTLDELGIAPIRDGFSNLFFPGTSTIQTRAKYFFIVPYALRDLELSPESNPNRIQIGLDAKERACAEKFLLRNSDESGVIGKRSLASGRWVKRTPADIYWSGLRRYGIFIGGNLSLSEYIRAMCAHKTQKGTLKSLGSRNDNAEENERDDDYAGDVAGLHFWRIPVYTKNWFDQMEIELTPAEGAYLKEQIISLCPDSMMAHILRNNMIEALDISSFQELETIINKFPEDVQSDYTLALTFSDFVYTIRTVYNVILSDAQNEDANKELLRLRPVFPTLADIEIDEIMKRLGIYQNPALRAFLFAVQGAMIEDDLDALMRCIRSREIALKGQSRAKTSHPGQYDDAWLGGGELDYRFGNARVILQDIFRSEGVWPHVES